MFENYSQTYASQILALSGFVAVIARSFGFEWAESEVVFILGVVANLGGIIWALVHRKSKGDVTTLGVRK